MILRRQGTKTSQGGRSGHLGTGVGAQLKKGNLFMNAVSFTATTSNGCTSTPAESDSVHDAETPQAAKEAAADLVKDTQQQGEALAGDAGRVAELAPPIEETPDDPPGEESEQEFVTSEKPACVPKPNDVLWICLSCIEGFNNPTSGARRVRVISVRDLHEKPLRLSEYHSYWPNTPFDRYQIEGEIVEGGDSRFRQGQVYKFWIPGPHAAADANLRLVEWPIQDGNIVVQGPEFTTNKYSRGVLTCTARKLREQGDAHHCRIMPAIPQETTEGDVA